MRGLLPHIAGLVLAGIALTGIVSMIRVGARRGRPGPVCDAFDTIPWLLGSLGAALVSTLLFCGVIVAAVYAFEALAEDPRAGRSFLRTSLAAAAGWCVFALGGAVMYRAMHWMAVGILEFGKDDNY